MKIQLDREYEVKCTLGTIRDIEKSLGKGFFELMGGVSKMTTEEQLKMLYAGVKRANRELRYEEFDRLCEEHLGIGDLMDLLEKYLYGLQYPGLTEEEAGERIEKKLQASRALQASRG